MCDEYVRCKIWYMICDADVWWNFINLRCDMYRTICMVLGVVWSSDILCALKWVFLKSFQFGSLWGVVFSSSETDESWGGNF